MIIQRVKQRFLHETVQPLMTSREECESHVWCVQLFVSNLLQLDFQTVPSNSTVENQW